MLCFSWEELNETKKMIIKKIISGGQVGADIAGIDAAMANNFPYGGWLPKGRRTENGSLDARYRMREMKTRSYPKRTEQNVIDSDGTVIFVHGKLSGGSELTRRYAVQYHKPWLHLNMSELTAQKAIKKLTHWVQVNNIEILNVAGRSAGKDSKIYDVTFTVMSNFLSAQYSLD